MPYTLYVGLPAGQLPNQTNRITSSPIWLWSYRGIQAMEVGAWGWRYTYLCISCHPLHVHLTSPYRRSFYLSSISVCVFQFVELVSISFDTNNSTTFLLREGGLRCTLWLASFRFRFLFFSFCSQLRVKLLVWPLTGVHSIHWNRQQLSSFKTRAMAIENTRRRVARIIS